MIVPVCFADCRSGATFANCPTEVGERTADGTLLLLLATTRGLTTHFLSAREGRWRDHSIKSLNWRTKTLGIIGLGSIGLKVAQMARGLGFRVIYSNRRRSTVTDEFEFVTRQELYAQADVVVLMTPLNDETRHMIDKDAITQMRDGVVIVNTCECGASLLPQPFPSTTSAPTCTPVLLSLLLSHLRVPDRLADCSSRTRHQRARSGRRAGKRQGQVGPFRFHLFLHA